MPHKSNVAPKAHDGQRLLLLTLMVETAIQTEAWPEVTELLNARALLIDRVEGLPENIASELAIVEERMLTTLRLRLGAVRADLRNLSAALRIARPYSNAPAASLLSLAG